jgi:hypothetical protein
MYREQAIRLGVEKLKGNTAVIAEYRSADTAGRARIQVTPEILVKDTLLRN